MYITAISQEVLSREPLESKKARQWALKYGHLSGCTMSLADHPADQVVPLFLFHTVSTKPLLLKWSGTNWQIYWLLLCPIFCLFSAHIIIEHPRGAEIVKLSIL